MARRALSQQGHEPDRDHGLRCGPSYPATRMGNVCGQSRNHFQRLPDRVCRLSPDYFHSCRQNWSKTSLYLGSAFGLRSLFGFGAGAISPVVFGAVLDWTNPHAPGQPYDSSWGWAFVILGLPGFGAIWSVRSLQKLENKARVSPG